ncbi:site-specific DNA-methyltransferase [Tessaracoccus sp. OH4464_COT-324]|uniref:site-specific DNA-methyltransferase n=1 Tax=Tessaracoccus sp. OH4464_COT-324 TaxID=2491059 RepID=UPI000F633BDE|nr:site-specific DNA-methyltransferase [Tessaracoccus sp. OH4464_COT-324]RRD46758.1 site-specific DNA-methyltransferase [Tessaracoccus sp. OH4464_COT-324]
MEKRIMHSPDLVARNVEKIAELFPTVVTETRDKDGNVTTAIDFDLLRQELSDHIVEGPQERYRLDWPGKRAAALAANAPIAKTLRPVREESVDFDTTKNIFIEGDNLDALKLLQESYLGKVKLIYIDPPYNTGNDFIYEDDFAETVDEYLARSGQADELGGRLVANSEASGRYHSDWLSMMYPRLKLARSLLSDRGVLFVSVDDHERDNLRRLLDEVFGEKAFVGAVVWRKKASPDARSSIGSVHDYILCYVRNGAYVKEALGRMSLSAARVADYVNHDDDPRGPWVSVDMTGMTGRATKEQYFEVKLPSGRVVGPPAGRAWGVSEGTFRSLLEDGRIWFGKNGDGVPRVKKFLSESNGQAVPTYWDFSEVGSNEEGAAELNDLFGAPHVFDAPKPTRLMLRILEIATAPARGDIVLDFFAGSSSMGDAVFRANFKDGGDRRFLMVQIPGSGSGKSGGVVGNRSLSSISLERLRRAAARLKEGKVDLGFRSFRVDSTSMRQVFCSGEEVGQAELTGLAPSIKPDRTAEDLLFQVILDWGLELSLPITRDEVDGREVFDVDDGALLACFEDAVTPEVVRAIAERGPQRAVFRDDAFASDAARINAEQVFRELSPGTEVRTI